MCCPFLEPYMLHRFQVRMRHGTTTNKFDELIDAFMGKNLRLMRNEDEDD